MLKTRELMLHINPTRTILRSNHVSNFLNLAGSYPKDREQLIKYVNMAIERASMHPGFLDEVPGYTEEY